MKQIIFLAHTEYHVMMSVHMAKTFYSGKEFANSIYLTRVKNESEKLLRNYKNGNIAIEQSKTGHSPELIHKIVKKEGQILYFFQERNILNQYLVHQYRKKGARICLAQDGIKPYGLFSKNHEILSMLKDTFTSYRSLFKKGLWMWKLYPAWHYRYGSSKHVDEVWLTHPELFNSKKNRTKGIIKKIPEFTEKTWETLYDLYHFNIDQIPRTDRCLFYINQPFWTNQLIDREIQFLEDVSRRFKDIPLILKIHPVTPDSTVDRYNSLPNVTILNSSIPAELFIRNLRNSIVFSGWSTSLAMNNLTCNFYYNRPIYLDLNDKKLSQIELSDIPNVGLVKNAEEMRFPQN